MVARGGVHGGSMTDLDSGSGSREARGRGLKLSIVSAAAGVAMMAFALGLGGLGGGTAAQAIAPCVQHANTPEELQFLGLLQSWRNGTPSLAGALTLSAPLNAAAFGYADYLATHPNAAGHFADGTSGFPWVTRSISCGYPANLGAGGEGLAVVEASFQVTVTPQQALNTMTAEGGGGVYVPNNVGYPTKCVGVGKSVSADGKKVAWVTLIMAGPTSADCPQAVSGTAPTPTPTNTNTPTATPTKTSTPTSTPTPQARFGVQLQIAPDGWALVTLPAGNIAQVLARAYGCYAVVYELRGDTWLRYSPDVPSYARNLTDSDGGAFWILGTAKDCGTISL